MICQYTVKIIKILHLLFWIFFLNLQKSTNGTFISNDKIEPEEEYPLKHGEFVGLGCNLSTFEKEDLEEEQYQKLYLFQLINVLNKGDDYDDDDNDDNERSKTILFKTNNGLAITLTDLDIVQSKKYDGWLTDKIFLLWLEDLTYKIDSAERYRTLRGKYYFVDPEVVQALKCKINPDVEEEAHKKELIFFIINNARPNEEKLSSHWSLLFFQRSIGRFYIFDSLERKKKHEAIAKGSLVYDHLDLNFVAETYKYTGSQAITAIIINSVLQVNRRDCGFFVQKNIEYILSDIEKSPTGRFSETAPQYTPDEVEQMRREMAARIENSDYKSIMVSSKTEENKFEQSQKCNIYLLFSYSKKTPQLKIKH